QEGLPDSRVAPIMQDREGYMWFGTQAGLTRYDGSEFVNVTQAKDIPGIFGRDIIEDHAGAIWFAYTGIEHGGLLRLWNGKITEYSRADGLSGDQAGCVVEDANHDIWIGTSRGLDRIHFTDSARASFTVKSHLPHHASALFVDRSGKLWIGTSGVFSYSNGEFKDELMAHNIHVSINVRPYAMYESSDGDLWVGAYEGVLKLSNGSATFFTTKEGLPERGVWSFCEDKVGNFWVGTADGLYRLRQDNNSYAFVKEQSFGDAIVYDICLDREGNIWFASAPGIRKLVASDFVLDFPGRELLATAGFGPILQDHDGGIYFGSRNTGLYYLNGSTLRSGLQVAPSSSLTFTAMFNQSPARIWFGLKYGGGFVKEGSYVRNYDVPDGLPSAHVNAFASISDARMLLGTANGLAYVDSQGAVHRLSHPDIDGLTLFDLKLAPRGQGEPGGANNIWMATMRGIRLVRMHDDSIVSVGAFPDQPALIGTIVYEILIDKDRSTWFGTDGKGLIRYDGSSFKSFTREEGLASNRVYALAQDSVGSIWVGTSSGLSQFDGESFRNFTHDQGFSEIGLHGLMVDRAGFLWVSSFPGITKLKPDRFYKSNLPPPVYLTETKVDTIPFTGAARFEVSPDHGVVIFRYAGLSFSDESNVRYKYKLEGYDREWSALVKTREVRYTHLPAGDYVFQVLARSRDGVWSAKPASVSFTVLPPLWARWWFIALSTLAISFAAYSLYRYRLNKLLELERTRSRIAMDLHDDIGSSLTRISVLSEVAQHQDRSNPAAVPETLGKIGDTARELIDSLSDIVWSVDPKHDNLQNVIHHIVQFGQETCEGRGIEFETDLVGDFTATKLSLEQRRDIFLIFKEAITNIVRHSKASRTVFRVYPDRSNAALELT
ncbi:MAG: two-component regulator propeller domain-containing protein, partial [Bacteroidota bacterium]